MKEIHLRCKKCHRCLETDRETERGLCSRCEGSGARRRRLRIRKEYRSSFLDESLDPLGLENLGE